MHELSLVNQIQGIVERAAGERQVHRVHLQVGQLRQVVPETLRYCWGLSTQGGALEGSELVIQSIPVTVRCGDCDADSVVEHRLVLVCRGCGSGTVTVTAGEEFLLTSLDLAPLPTKET